VRRLVLGSVAEAVIRQSTMPVLLVRGTSSEQ
ncbi:MAG TPA: universal stress protein UspA, partial [Cupriavidus sp.]|nr:universal stress protein UspA [Cupriavidus sp.]